MECWVEHLLFTPQEEHFGGKIGEALSCVSTEVISIPSQPWETDALGSHRLTPTRPGTQSSPAPRMEGAPGQLRTGKENVNVTAWGSPRYAPDVTWWLFPFCRDEQHTDILNPDYVVGMAVTDLPPRKSFPHLWANKTTPTTEVKGTLILSENPKIPEMLVVFLSGDRSKRLAHRTIWLIYPNRTRKVAFSSYIIRVSCTGHEDKIKIATEISGVARKSKLFSSHTAQSHRIGGVMWVLRAKGKMRHRGSNYRHKRATDRSGLDR